MTRRFNSADAPVNDNLTEKHAAERAHLADVRRRHEAQIAGLGFIADGLERAGVAPPFLAGMRRGADSVPEAIGVIEDIMRSEGRS